MPLKAVLFDLGLTLIQTASYPEIYRRILARFGITTSLDAIVQAQNATESEFDIATYDENRRKDFWINYNVSLLEKLGIKKNIDFLAEQISSKTTINVMNQYRPCYKASSHPKINRRPTFEEIETIRQYAIRKGLNVLI